MRGVGFGCRILLPGSARRCREPAGRAPPGRSPPRHVRTDRSCGARDAYAISLPFVAARAQRRPLLTGPGRTRTIPAAYRESPDSYTAFGVVHRLRSADRRGPLFPVTPETGAERADRRALVGHGCCERLQGIRLVVMVLAFPSSRPRCLGPAPLRRLAEWHQRPILDRIPGASARSGSKAALSRPEQGPPIPPAAIARARCPPRPASPEENRIRRSEWRPGDTVTRRLRSLQRHHDQRHRVQRRSFLRSAHLRFQFIREQPGGVEAFRVEVVFPQRFVGRPQLRPTISCARDS